MSITIYTQPRCVRCDITKRTLEAAGLTYETIDLVQDPEALAEVKRRGFAQAPVVITDDDAWSGFRPDKIKQLS